MTDRDVMVHRFLKENIHAGTGELAKRLGIPRKHYEEAYKRALEKEKIQTQATMFIYCPAGKCHPNKSA